MAASHEALEEILESAASKGGEGEIAFLREGLRLAAGLLGSEGMAAFLNSDQTMDTLRSAACDDEAEPAKDVEELIDSAKAHGDDSEPDMEPGDLQVYLREAFEALSPEYRDKFIAAMPALDGATPGP